MIDPAGGEVELDGAKLIVPAGALTQAIEIRITKTDEPVPDGYTAFSARYRFEPAGLKFALPVTVELPFEGDPSRATLFWSQDDGPAYTWLSTTIERSIGSAQIVHFSDGFVGDGVNYTDPVDRSCVTTNILDTRLPPHESSYACPPPLYSGVVVGQSCCPSASSPPTECTPALTIPPTRKPADIAMVATADDCHDNPITDLQPSDFVLQEDGRPLSKKESDWTLIPRPGLQVFVTLLLDLSDSTKELRPQLYAAAKLFVEQIQQRVPDRVQIGLVAFAGSTVPTTWIPHTLDHQTLIDALDQATSPPPAATTPTLPCALLGLPSGCTKTQVEDYCLSAGSAGVAGGSIQCDALLAQLLMSTPSQAGPLRPPDLSGTTNLFGSLISSIDQIDEVGQAFENRNFGGALTSRYVVVFSDGDDRASYRTLSEVQTRQMSTTTRVMAVGIESPDYQLPVLQAIAGVRNVFSADGAARLYAAFGAMANRIAGQIARTYLIGYCSPSRAMQHTVSVGVMGATMSSASTSVPFDAASFTDGCKVTDFTTACDTPIEGQTNHKQCGGLLCGACDDRTERCDGETFACVDTCDIYNQCAGRALDVRPCDAWPGETTGDCGIDVPSYTYARTCDDRPTAVVCGNSCVDSTSTTPAHCGGAASVFSGEGDSCALLQDQSLRCWGANEDGQLGLGDLDNRGDDPREMGNWLPSVVQPDGRHVVSVAAGTRHTCVLVDDGSVSCWGNDPIVNGLGRAQPFYGIPANSGGGPLNSWPTVKLGTGRSAVAIAAGERHNCALLDDGRIKCWGYRQLDGLSEAIDRGKDGAMMGDALPFVILGVDRTATQIAAGNDDTCVIRDDHSTFCWGLNTYGELGMGSKIAYVPSAEEASSELDGIDLGTGRTATAIGVGDGHACALLDDGSLKCWGRNDYGQLGLGDNNNRGDAAGEMGDALPVVGLGAGRSAKAISLFGRNTCALLDDGTVKCWGISFGRDLPENLTPIPLGTGRTAQAVATGGGHACALLDDATVKCWGSNASGQQGQDDAKAHDATGSGDLLPIVVW